ncbi:MULTISPECIES: hypothetical protein [Aeribacillus]|uniref:hypothetical protein n=1 Tax=Aeribacillus TaxID=1055323 RepID=UPI001022BBC1|nr:MULTISPECIES: hypothetical protein [Aeribacillus]MED0702407.1 hypothetical protein [Aeribacillus composti]RZI50001.1 hypothetical protein EW027_17855 [Aeribacillus pallidus]
MWNRRLKSGIGLIKKQNKAKTGYLLSADPSDPTGRAVFPLFSRILPVPMKQISFTQVNTECMYSVLTINNRLFEKR